MSNTAKKNLKGKARIVTDDTIKNYTNDPYFVKKRETAEAFLKKAGLPPSFSKPQTK